MNARRVMVAAVLLLTAFIGSGGTAAAQQPAVPDFSGGWLRIDEGSGSFDGTAAKQPPAALTDAGRALTGTRRRPECDSAGRRHRPGESGRPGLHHQ